MNARPTNRRTRGEQATRLPETGSSVGQVQAHGDDLTGEMAAGRDHGVQAYAFTFG
jgi:hypothetical protein